MVPPCSLQARYWLRCQCWRFQQWPLCLRRTGREAGGGVVLGVGLWGKVLKPPPSPGLRAWRAASLASSCWRISCWSCSAPASAAALPWWCHRARPLKWCVAELDSPAMLVEWAHHTPSLFCSSPSKVLAVLLLFAALFSGFVVARSEMPPYMVWVNYIVPLTFYAEGWLWRACPQVSPGC